MDYPRLAMPRTEPLQVIASLKYNRLLNSLTKSNLHPFLGGRSLTWFVLNNYCYTFMQVLSKPRNWRRSFTYHNTGHSFIKFTFSRYALTPCFPTMQPSTSILGNPMTHFCKMTYSWPSPRVFNTTSKSRLCDSISLKQSSVLLWTST